MRFPKVTPSTTDGKSDRGEGGRPSKAEMMKNGRFYSLQGQPPKSHERKSVVRGLLIVKCLRRKRPDITVGITVIRAPMAASRSL